MIDRYTLPKMKGIWSEENKFRKWLEVEIAVCQAWAKLKKIPAITLKKIKSKANFDIKRINEIEKKVDHDVIAFLTSVSEKVGPDSRYIHMGMTSSDVVDTSLALLMRESAGIIIADIKDLIKVLRKMAKKYKDTLMIGRSHGVHAEPLTFGLKMALFMTEMQRNLMRMERAKEAISVGQVSGAVGTYSNIDPRVEEYVCKYLGLAPAPISSQVLQRDRHAEYLTTLAIVGGTIEKIATEIRALQKTECNEVEEPFKKGQKGSSAMPHKRNPITCERLCGMARLLRGNAQVALENQNLWHERDISHSSAERVVIPDSSIIMDYMLQKCAWIIDNLVVHPENMKRNIEKTGGLIFSQRLLMALIEKGMTRDAAYELVQAAAMKARSLSKNLKTIALQDQKIIKKLGLKEIEAAFDTSYFIRNIGKIFDRLEI